MKMDSMVFIFMGFMLLIFYMFGIIMLSKAKQNQPQKESKPQKEEEITQEQAYQVIQTLYNNQLLSQSDYNKCIGMGMGLFKS
jgi:Na+-transporting methylmalonyl-CoA/oxaloacetate decarboxylase gamma subunit